MDIEDVENLAELAKIELTDKEKEDLLSDMKGILAYVKQIEKVEAPDAYPEYQNRNMWREDTPRILGEEIFSHDLIVKQFPNNQDNFVKVKKIL